MNVDSNLRLDVSNLSAFKVEHRQTLLILAATGFIKWRPLLYYTSRRLTAGFFSQIYMTSTVHKHYVSKAQCT